MICFPLSPKELRVPISQEGSPLFSNFFHKRGFEINFQGSEAISDIEDLYVCTYTQETPCLCVHVYLYALLQFGKPSHSFNNQKSSLNVSSEAFKADMKRLWPFVSVLLYWKAELLCNLLVKKSTKTIHKHLLQISREGEELSVSSLKNNFVFFIKSNSVWPV